MAAKPISYSTQEIDDAIMQGFAKFADDQKRIKTLLGAADDIAILGATWKIMSSTAKDHLKRTAPDLHQKATTMFGQ